MVATIATTIATLVMTLAIGLSPKMKCHIMWRSVLGFAIWLTIGDGILTFLIALLWKRNAMWKVARSHWATGFAGGAMQVGAYWIIVWALAHAPMGMVSALRETSVLFAALISTFVLREGFGAWRFVSASFVMLGLILSRQQK